MENAFTRMIEGVVEELEGTLKTWRGRERETEEKARKVTEDLTSIAGKLRERDAEEIGVQEETGAAVWELAELLRRIADEAQNVDFGADLRIQATRIFTYFTSRGIEILSSGKIRVHQ